MRKKIAAVILATGVGIGGLGIASCEAPEENKQGGTDQGVGSKDATADVALGELRITHGVAEIPATVINHSSETSDYTIEATLFDTTGNQVGTALAFVQRLQPDTTAKTTLTSMEGTSAMSAELSLVERVASL